MNICKNSIKVINSILFILPLFLLLSCTKDMGVGEKTSGDITLKVSINPERRIPTPQKLATSNVTGLKDGAVAVAPPVSASDFTSKFSVGDEIGVYMVPAGQSLTDENAVFKNVKFTFNGTDWSSAVNWPKEGASFDFYAYYPYKADARLTNSRFFVETDQSSWANFQKSDLMVAQAKAVTKGSTVALNFNHLMSMVQLSLGANELKSQNPDKDMVVSLAGIKTGVNYSLQDQTAVSLDGNRSNIKMYRVEKPGDANYNTTFTYRALLPAQDLPTHSNRLIFSQGVQTFVRAQDTKLTLNTGTVHYMAQPPLEGLWQAVWIEPGIFQMGSPESDVDAKENEKPQHWVRLTKGFYMGKYEVTVGEYAAFLNAVQAVPDGAGKVYVSLDGRSVLALDPDGRGGHHKLMYSGGKWKHSGGINLPMAWLTFQGARAYAKWAGGDLPTEAQWEYACRAGTDTPWSYGDYYQYPMHAWLQKQNTRGTGDLMANPWGLYDMHGNVAEYCLWNGRYPVENNTQQTPIKDPVGNNQTSYFVRGGSYEDQPHNARSAVRTELTSENDLNVRYGFRIIKYK